MKYNGYILERAGNDNIMILTETLTSATCSAQSLIKSAKSVVYHTSIHVIKRVP